MAKFKDGDTVVCIQAKNPRDRKDNRPSGYGWKLGLKFKITHYHSPSNSYDLLPDNVYFGGKNGNGVWEEWLAYPRELSPFTMGKEDKFL